MPTINQLIRKPRVRAAKKSKAPALGSIVNTLKTKHYNQPAPLKRGVCIKVTTKIISWEDKNDIHRPAI